MMASSAAAANVTFPERAGCSASCCDTGVTTTIGNSSANISRLRPWESAMWSRPTTSAIRGGESLMPR